MTTEHFQRLIDCFPNVVSNIRSKQFDSHAFIKKLIKLHPREYIVAPE